MRARGNVQGVIVLRSIHAQRGSTRTARLKSGAHTRDLNGSSMARRDFRPTDRGHCVAVRGRHPPNAERQTPNSVLCFLRKSCLNLGHGLGRHFGRPRKTARKSPG
jgi:hypothetical protein